jgi:hypothetical protein
MSNHKIDDLVLRTVGESWTKVAMVIAQVSSAMGNDLPSGDEGCYAIAERIEQLVRDGRLAAQGDIRRWRFSEIRRTGDGL